MAKHHLTRRGLLAAAAPLAAAPLVARYALDSRAAAAGHEPRRTGITRRRRTPAMGHAAMIGARRAGRRRPARPRRAPLPAARRSRTQPGRVREYTLTAIDREIEVAPGRVLPGLDVQRHGARARAPRDRGRHPARPASSTPARTRTRSTSTASTRRTWTASSRSSRPGGEFTYEFEARPYGMQLYHCHATPLKKHIHKGLYGALIIDPKEPRAAGAGARDGDERLRHRRRRRQQLLHRQRPHVLLRALPDPGQALASSCASTSRT